MHYFYGHYIHKTIGIKFKTFTFCRIIIKMKKKVVVHKNFIKTADNTAKQLYGALCKLIFSCNLVDNYSSHFC